MPAILRANTESELDAFERVGHQLAGFDDRLHPEWIDGYLTALFAGPRAIAPEEWMPKAFGDTFDRAFGDPGSAAEALAALRARWRVIAAQLDPERLVDEPDVLFLSPLMWSPDADEMARLDAESEADVEAEARWPGEGDEWAEGFLSAVSDFADDWTLGRADGDQAGLLSELLSQVQALTFARDSQALTEHLAAAYPESVPSRDELIDEACASIQEMRVFWIDFAPRPPPRTVEKAPGRNDFCPCGSGRKFKKCHGATPA